MCININNRIQQLQQQKAEIDAKLQLLENLQQQTNLSIDALKQLVNSYRENAPQELESFVSCVLSAVGFTFSVSTGADDNSTGADDNSTGADDKPEEFDELVEAYYSSGEFAAADEEEEEPQPEPAPAIDRPAVEAFQKECDAIGDAYKRISAAVEENRQFSTYSGLLISATNRDFKDSHINTYRVEKYGFIPAVNETFLGRYAGGHKGWAIYFEAPNGGIVGIDLVKLQNAATVEGENQNLVLEGEIYSCDTEAFNLDRNLRLDDFDGILNWVKEAIDTLDAPLSGDELYELFNVTFSDLSRFSPIASGYCVVSPHLSNGGAFAGATFTYFDTEDKQFFSSSQTPNEIERGENNPELMATSLLLEWQRRQEAAKFPPPGTTAEIPQPKDPDFVEFVKISNNVAYLKRKDNGQILAGYIGLSNKTSNGDRTNTMASNRAKKWAEALSGDFGAKCEVRKPKRMESENPRAPFAYEVKFSGLSIGQIVKISEQNFDLLPYEDEIAAEDAAEEQAQETATAAPLTIETWSITVNGYSWKCGNKEEIQEIFATKCLELSPAIPAIELYKGATKVESYRLSDFEFVEATDFDRFNPEYRVKWSQYDGAFTTNLWSSLRSSALEKGGVTLRLWRHKLLEFGEEIELKTKEAAAVHAVQRWLYSTTK